MSEKLCLAATLILSVCLSTVEQPAGAQEAKGNPLEGLFTPQPQYVTPQTTMNPEPQIPSGSAHPIQQLFNVQPQYVTPQQQNFALPNAPQGTTNHLQGFFTGQNPFQTPQTPQNPQGIPKSLSPEFVHQAEKQGVPLTEREQALIQELKAAEAIKEVGENPAGSGEKEKGAEAKEKEKTETVEKEKPKEEKEKETKEKESKEKEAKEKETKEKEAKEAAEKEKAEEEKKAEEEREKARAAAAKQRYNPLQEAAFHISTGNNQQAVTVATKVISASPKNAQAYYLRAVANVSLRRYQEAQHDYRQVLQLVPGTELGRLAQNGLNKLAP